MREDVERSSRIGRRAFLLGSGAALGAGGLRPRAARAQTPAGPRGEIVAGLSERALTLDPANHYSISATSVLRHIFDPLVDVTNDSKFIPALAESWRPISNTAWRFVLRRGVLFHDGTPFTADSVVYTIKRVRDNTKLIKAFVYQDVESVEKDGDYAVTVVKSERRDVEGDPVKSVLPERYATPATSPLRVPVRETANVMSLDLLSQ